MYDRKYYEDVLEKMKACRINSPDTESHIEADELLVKTIRALAKDTPLQIMALLITDEYQKVCMWYE